MNASGSNASKAKKNNEINRFHIFNQRTLEGSMYGWSPV